MPGSCSLTTSRRIQPLVSRSRTDPYDAEQAAFAAHNRDATLFQSFSKCPSVRILSRHDQHETFRSRQPDFPSHFGVPCSVLWHPLLQALFLFPDCIESYRIARTRSNRGIYCDKAMQRWLYYRRRLLLWMDTFEKERPSDFHNMTASIHCSLASYGVSQCRDIFSSHCCLFLQTALHL